MAGYGMTILTCQALVFFYLICLAFWVKGLGHIVNQDQVFQAGDLGG